jgi:5-hydroxyisourate hydrolase-like protein (transthyretin family)
MRTRPSESFRAQLKLALVMLFMLGSSEPAGAANLISGLGGDRGYGEGVLSDNDDGSTSAIDITPVFGSEGLNFFGTKQLALYVNNNGNITFNGATSQYTPTGITAASNPIIAAFFADVDTRGGHDPAGSNLVYYDLDPTNHIFTATWDLVGYYSRHTDKLNNFQIRLVGRPDQGAGDFDIEIRYQHLQWTTGDASGGQGGLGGSVARAGYSAGNNEDFYEFPEAGDQAGMLDLVNRSNVGPAGLFVFQVRNGAVTPPPTFTPSRTPTPTPTPTVTGTQGIPTPPTCDGAPATAVNALGAQHDMTVTVRHGSGAPAAGVTVTAEIVSGPHAGSSASGSTDADGRHGFFYSGNTPGTDTIHFSGVVDGQPFSCSITKTWVQPPPPCTVSPPSDTNRVGTQHTVTATFRHGDNSPAADASVSISISSGPNAPLLADAVTNASGQVVFSYTGGPHAGTDVIEFGGVVDGEVVQCSAGKTWELPPPPPCTVSPGFDMNPVGSQHIVTAVFRRGDGSPAASAPVSISISSGPNALLLADAVTNAAGQVAFTYTGGAKTGTDVIEFGGVVDDQVVGCSATKTWVAAEPTCKIIPNAGVNRVGTEHAVTAIFQRADGPPAAGVGVAVGISSGPNSGLLADALSDGRGQVAFAYIGGPNAGTDVIEFAGFVDDEIVRCSATKTWVAAQPTCEAFPTSDINPAGARHTATAIFRRGDGSPAAGALVSISISSGPNALLLADGVTNSGGQVGLSYTGGPNAGTDVIEFSGFVDDQIVRCTATKTWVAVPPRCDVVPSSAVNQIGTDHTVAAIFRRGNGAPAAGAGVSISITSGPNALLLADALTNQSGFVALSYTGGPNLGTDLIEFSGFVDDQLVSCSATKTWVAAQPTCDVFPSTALNAVGTRHTVTAVFRRGNGSPAAGAGVSISIGTGPNALLLADAVTNGSGLAGLSYNGGPNPGTDVIDFAGFVDGQVVRCRATKTWVRAQPTCDVAPGTDVNRVETAHTATATFRRGNGAPAAAVGVSIAIASGPNALLLADAVTNGSGQVRLSYTGGTNTGTDVIEFAGFVDGQVVRCTSTKTWVAAQPTCSAAPSTAVNSVGTQHTVTAVFTRGNGAPAAAANVSISIPYGPNALLLADAVTNASGQVGLSYTGGPNPGTDVIEFAGVVDGQVVRCSATKTWARVQPTCDTAPGTDVNQVETGHTVTATFRRGNGSPAAAVGVAISIASGPNALLLADAVTNASGQVALSYTGGTNTGTDVIEFAGFVDGQVVRCTATKTWVAAAPPACDAAPTTAVNPVGTQHTVTASFRRGNGAPAAAAAVSVNVTSGPNSQVHADGVTNADGRVTFAYTGGPTSGTDTIEFSAMVDSQLARCTAAKTWVVARPSCDTVPDTAVNPVGTEHRVTAGFRRSNGTPAAGVSVSINIASGPNAGVLADAATNASGQVTWAYTGGANVGTDAIEFSAFIDGQVVRCTATNTWIAAVPTCDVAPPLAANAVGGGHTVTATFRRGNGAPAAGTSVSISIASGPNAGVFADAVTNAEGQVGWTYTGGPNAGTDVIEFSGMVDGQAVSCTANKVWGVARARCDVTPATAVNSTGTQHAATAIFRRSDGSPAVAANVAIDIAYGPNAPRHANAITSGSGQVAFTYIGGQNAGTDVIQFTGTVDGQAVQCSANKTWVAAQSTCEVTPAAAANQVNTDHALTAIFRHGDGSPAAGIAVAVNIGSGPNSPLTANAGTNASGQVAFTYTGGPNTGTDVIEFSGLVDGQLARCSAAKSWSAPQPTCDAVPGTAQNPLGTRHTVTATFRKGDGSPAAGVRVNIGITSAEGSPLLPAALTDANGQVVRCSASKTWGAAQPTCEVAPARTLSQVGTQHALTATVRRGNGAPVAGASVAINVASGPNAVLLADGVTNGSGQVGFTYTGGPNTGTDIVAFSTLVDGQDVRCSATSAWAQTVPTPTATPSPCVDCVGDCGCDGLVTIDEILTMVNIALGNAGVGLCLPGDANGDSYITVDEILTAVNNALTECPVLIPTVTPTRTSTLTQVPATATRTPTPTTTSATPPTRTSAPTTTPSTPQPTTGPSISKRAAGTTVTLTQGLRVIPAIISALAPIAKGGGSSASEGSAAAAKNCGESGTYDLTCTQPTAGMPPRNYSLSLSSCKLMTTPGTTVTLTGALSGTSTETGFLASCNFPPLALSTFAVTGLQVTAANAGGTTLSAGVNLTGSLSVTPDIFSSCKISAVDMTLNGTISVQVGTLSETLTFNNTSVRVEVGQFNDDCVPLIYTITLNGSATLAGGGGASFSGTFTDFVFTDNTTTGNDLVILNGAVDSTCLGTAATFQTQTSLSFPPAAVCPIQGAVRVTSGGHTDRVTYRSAGVDIDLGDNGSVDESFTNCVDLQLLACPAG